MPLQHAKIMSTIAANLQAVRERIARGALAAGRAPVEIALVAVSKGFAAGKIAEAYACGQRVFGESYVQEALPKIRVLAHLPIEWHFVGPIQSNKTRAIAEHFAWAHSVDRMKIAERLAAARPVALPPLQVCIQLNLGAEGTKSGVAPGAELELAQCVLALPRLALRGLMAIPRPTPEARLQRAQFAGLREIKERLVNAGVTLDTLSMGMSDDLEAAIAEGATIVRVGTAIFGPRRAG